MPGCILIEGAQDLLGAQNVSAILSADPCAGIEGTHLRFPALLTSRYGVEGGRGMALRVGRSVFHRILQRARKSDGEERKLTSIEFRLLPAHARFEQGLQILAGVYRKELGSDALLVANDGGWLLRLDCCSDHNSATADGAFCYLVTGLLQEFMGWAGGGKIYHVQEIECRASGGEKCVFRIDPKPLD